MYKKGYINRLLTLCVVLTMSGVLGIWTPSKVHARNDDTTTSNDTRLDSVPTQTFMISYAESAEWLERLPIEDRNDQIRDWMVISLSSLLEFDQESLSENFLDMSPFRDPYFTNLVTYQNGPGRSLLDSGEDKLDVGDDKLHLLIPENDPYQARSIGMVLDNRRRDMEVDPNEVILYYYQINHESREIQLKSFAAQSTDELRRKYGYIETAINTLDDLQIFLAQTQHLSQVRVENGTLWVGGWNWPNTPTGYITAEDLTVLQKGYLNAAQPSLLQNSEPGFSLDPGPPLTLQELLPILEPFYPELEGITDKVILFVEAWSEIEVGGDFQKLRELLIEDPDFINRNILHTDETGEAECSTLFLSDSCAERIDTALADRRHPWRLLFDTSQGDPPYQFARYDGGLEGTEVGMTYFYTDILVKGWRYEIGDGNPYSRVDGFVPSALDGVPWSHCTNEDEEGRIWFGLDERSLSILSNRVNFGDITTRLFTLIQDPEHGEQEIEPSYHFGQGVWWWDSHYLSMADYEPQYHRLDQLMRWGAAVAWLVNQGDVLLPELPSEEIRDNWRLDQWLTAHPELKWKYDIPFIEVPEQKTETVLKLYSEPFYNCGQDWVAYGGVSNPSRILIQGIKNRQFRLATPGLRRAGLTQANIRTNTFTYQTGLQRARTLTSNSTRIYSTAPKPKIMSFGNHNVTLTRSEQLNSTLQLSRTGHRTAVAIGIENRPLAELAITTSGSVAHVKVVPEVMKHADDVVTQLNAVSRGQNLRTALGQLSPTHVKKVYYDPFTGNAHLYLPGALLVINETQSSHQSDGDFVFVPPRNLEGEYLYASAYIGDTGPELSEWLTVDAYQDGRPLIFTPASAPSTDADTFTIEFLYEGHIAPIVYGEEQIWLGPHEAGVEYNELPFAGKLFDSKAAEQINVSLSTGTPLTFDDGSFLMPSGDVPAFVSPELTDDLIILEDKIRNGLDWETLLVTESERLEIGHIRIKDRKALSESSSVFLLTLSENRLLSVYISSAGISNEITQSENFISAVQIGKVEVAFVGDHNVIEVTQYANNAQPSLVNNLKLNSLSTDDSKSSATIRLSAGRFSKPLWLEVVEGEYQLDGGAILPWGHAADVKEEWLHYESGLTIEIGNGGTVLNDKFYPQDTILEVDDEGRLIETSIPVTASTVASPPINELSEATISLEDLPDGFEPLPQDAVNSFLDDSIVIEHSFGYASIKHKMIIVGSVWRLSTFEERLGFNFLLENPQQLLDLMHQQGSLPEGEATLLEIDPVGEYSAGFTTKLVVDATFIDLELLFGEQFSTLHNDEIVFSRGSFAISISQIYPTDVDPANSLEQIATTWDSRISRVLDNASIISAPTTAPISIPIPSSLEVTNTLTVTPMHDLTPMPTLPDAVVTLSDLPLGFVSMLQEEIDFALENSKQEGFPLESMFGFANEEGTLLILGINLKIPLLEPTFVIDAEIDDHQTAFTNLIGPMNIISIEDVEFDLLDVEQIGNKSSAVSFEDSTTYFEALIFRRNRVLSFVMLARDKTVDFDANVSLQEIASLWDKRITEVLESIEE